MLLKQKSPSLSKNLALETFGELLIVFSTEVYLLYLLYSTARRCCLLHLVDLLTVASNIIGRGFNRSGATRAVALDISKAFDRVCHAGLLHKGKGTVMQIEKALMNGHLCVSKLF